MCSAGHGKLRHLFCGNISHEPLRVNTRAVASTHAQSTSRVLRFKMARLKIPGKKKDQPVDKTEKKVPILRIKKERLKPSKKKPEVIRPMVITLRRFREIFGDSDDEVR